MSQDVWYFEIGDGKTYGPFPLEKLQRWASAGNLMPTHRVRHADETEWVIAAHVPGLEETLAAGQEDTEPTTEEPPSFRQSLGKLGRVLTRKKKSSEAADQDLATTGDTTRPPSADSPSTGRTPDVVQLCDEILENAFARGASDIHLEPEDKIALVQLRVDGALETWRKIPRALHVAVISRFKVLAKMDIAERRAAQDGGFRYQLGPHERKVDIRVATLPTTHGERMTLRLLAVETEQLTIHRLGLSASHEKQFCAAMSHRQGLILVTGPTGSGKSTTLYAALRYLLAHHPGKIITIEDPVEFEVVGAAQVEVDASERVRFETALRNVLRSDPDVIMIGEIRDATSANIALQAALTGHLVFSSLHTNSAAGAITRLINLGLPPYLVAATLRLCIAQRLLRRLCPHCRTPACLEPAAARDLGRAGAAGVQVFGPGSCERCNERGYRGRVGVFEMLSMDPAMARQVLDDCSEAPIQSLQQQQGQPLLAEDATEKLLAGEISLQELWSTRIG